jgi:hypothetical protein
VSGFAERWLPLVTPLLAPKTAALYGQMLKLYILPTRLAGKKMRAVHPGDVTEILSKLALMASQRTPPGSYARRCPQCTRMRSRSTAS